MAQILDMPRLSDTMKEGVLRKWLKNEGDRLAPGDVIAEVETDKATMDFEAFDEGVLLKRLIGNGDAVPVGAPVAIVGKAGEDVAAALAEAKSRSGASPPPAKDKPAATAKDAPHAAPARHEPSPATRANGPPESSKPGTESPGRVVASPLARRLATDLGVDLRMVEGSGPGGRIVERDVRAAADDGPAPASARLPADARPAPSSARAAPAPAARSALSRPLPPSRRRELLQQEPAAPAPSAARPAAKGLPERIVPERRVEARPAASPPSDDQAIPLSPMRKTIARRLLESKTTVPHFYVTADADMDAAMSFREQVAEIHGARLSVNDLILKAAALALRRVPEANASFGDDAIVRHARVDVGIAVAIDDGLVTPVIRDADRKTLGQIANQARELAARARDRKLRPEEMTGATFTVSNLGMFGVREFAAIINPPEGAILAVGTVRREPVVRGDAVVIGQRMSLTLSCDHRVIDGAIGARLLQALVQILERPISLAF